MDGSKNFSMSDAQGIGVGQAEDWVAELKVVNHLLDAGRETVQIGMEVFHFMNIHSRPT